MIHVTKQAQFYALNGEVVLPEDFYGISGFKFVNHIVAWAKGGGVVHLDNAKRYIEHEVIGLGCRRMRSPVELLHWRPPYFNLPECPNVANTEDLLNLSVGTGSAFSLPGLFKKVVRMYVLLAREFDIVIEVPWIWTIKARAKPGCSQYPDPRPEENGGKGISSWCEHYLAAHGVGAYLEQLALIGDGEGYSRVDPGGLNLISDFCNEYGEDFFTRGDCRSLARRWRTRDAPSQPIILLSQAYGPDDSYTPPLQSRGVEGFSGVCRHPARSKVGNYDWDETGTLLRKTWPTELIDVNESQLGITQSQYDYWVPQIPKWAGIISTDMPKWIRMHRNFVLNDIYTTFHTFRGMNASWPPSPQTVVEDAVREVTGGGGPPPPPPPPPRLGHRPFINALYRDVLERGPRANGDYCDPGGMRSKQNRFWELLDQGYSLEECIVVTRLEMYQSQEYKNKNQTGG